MLVNVDVDESVVKALQDLADEGENLADALTKAVAQAKYLKENAVEGKIFVKKQGNLHEVALR